MLAPVPELALEIVEGPGAGRQIALNRPVVIGRAPDADLMLDDNEVSRHHARVAPASDGSAVVEDLDSVNGTFVNHNELHGRARLDPSDELLLGVTVIEVRSSSQITQQRTARRPVPPALAQAANPPAYVDRNVIDSVLRREESAGARELDKYVDVRVRRRAQLAPLPVVLLIALALIIYFAPR